MQGILGIKVSAVSFNACCQLSVAANSAVRHQTNHMEQPTLFLLQFQYSCHGASLPPIRAPLDVA